MILRAATGCGQITLPLKIRNCGRAKYTKITSRHSILPYKNYTSINRTLSSALHKWRLLMKHTLTTLALCTAFIMQPAQANQDGDCRFILNTAQRIYPQFFPDNPETEFLGPWCFRHYNSKDFGDTYAGIYRSTDGAFKHHGVYTLDGPFGKIPLYIGQTDEVIDLLKSQVKNELCDSGNNELTDIDHRQEGNTLFISTKGCIKPPKNNNFCELLPDTDEIGRPVETGIHLLMESNVSGFEFTGINIPSIPGFPNPLDSIVDDIANQKICIIHAPREATDLTVKTDICFNMSDELANIPGVNSSVEFRFRSTSKSEEVDDCFDTDAASIHNTVTDQTWIYENGHFELVK